MENQYLPIPSYVKETFYAYKMPKMSFKIEGKGSGIKTVFLNIEDVAKSLHTPLEYILKYLSLEFKAQTMNRKQDDNNYKVSILGKYTSDELQEVLDKFITTYILCPICKIPELAIFSKSEKLQASCSGCGSITNYEGENKFEQFVLKRIALKKEEYQKEKQQEEFKEQQQQQQAIDNPSDSKQCNAVDQFLIDQI